MSADSFASVIETLESLPATVRAIRRARGVSLRRVASESGVSFSTVTRIESGEDATVSSALALLRWAILPAPVATDVEIDLGDDTTVEPGAIIWTCDECGKRSRWEPGWTWYGSHRQLDLTGRPEAVLCSVACREKHAGAARLDPGVLS
ncbi:MAG: hypothetical protein CVT65_03775 [Actinobacteria bacterium HGW-Actinobacteria-5]|jgi:transcriptional regulator with XRE-family HTH domain|nr:MAG: hypothetical protein CVT65_03775 [Actinobacteria bacterium HGW-Actinobacteria-5]